jgi:hypothetical protein
MSEKYESIFEAALRLSPEQQLWLALGLLALLSQTEQQASPEDQMEQPMSSESIVAAMEAARRHLAASRASNQPRPQTTPERGKARRHFGAWDSGDERSADSERIDLDLAAEYDNSR